MDPMAKQGGREPSKRFGPEGEELRSGQEQVTDEALKGPKDPDDEDEDEGGEEDEEDEKGSVRQPGQARTPSRPSQGSAFRRK